MASYVCWSKTSNIDQDGNNHWLFMISNLQQRVLEHWICTRHIFILHRWDIKMTSSAYVLYSWSDYFITIGDCFSLSNLYYYEIQKILLIWYLFCMAVPRCQVNIGSAYIRLQLCLLINLGKWEPSSWNLKNNFYFHFPRLVHLVKPDSNALLAWWRISFKNLLTLKVDC